MPRRKRHCASCRRAFVAAASASGAAALCPPCRGGAEGAGRSLAGGPAAPTPDADASAAVGAASEDTDSDAGSGAGSEAEEDRHCTEIIDVDDDSDDEDSHGSRDDDEGDGAAADDDDLPLAALLHRAGGRDNENASPTPDQRQIVELPDDGTEPRGGGAEGNEDADSGPLVEFDVNRNRDLRSCSVCGLDLSHLASGWKGRLNHIKRCAKKHRYTAREARYNDDNELFATGGGEAAQEAAHTGAMSNPYAAATTNTAATNQAAWEVARRAESEPPTAFSALMAGARRAAKLRRIQAQSPPPPQQHQQQRRSRWRGRPPTDTGVATQGSCPSYKKIPNTDFVVDGFQYAHAGLTRNYFLTHFHSDHYGGITKAWGAGTIYCSVGTAELVHRQLGVDRRFLHPLPLGTATVLESRGRPVRVTPVDANHCPGAVMFLFHVGTRTVLHVGDFRWDRAAAAAQPALRPFLAGGERVDDLYLDTTYCDPKYDLPTQREAIEATIEVAQKEVQSAAHSHMKLLLVFGAYTIGKERLYFSVARKLGMKVFVDSRRMRLLNLLEWKENELSMLTTKPEETCIWVVPLGHINMKKLESYLTTRSGTFNRVVGFRPTGWSHSKRGVGIISSTTRGRIAVHSVPYSEHSSFPELIDCLKCLRPKRIIPTVSVGRSQQQIDLLLNHWRR